MWWDLIVLRSNHSKSFYTHIRRLSVQKLCKSNFPWLCAAPGQLEWNHWYVHVVFTACSFRALSGQKPFFRRFMQVKLKDIQSSGCFQSKPARVITLISYLMVPFPQVFTGYFFKKPVLICVKRTKRENGTGNKLLYRTLTSRSLIFSKLFLHVHNAVYRKAMCPSLSSSCLASPAPRG